MTHDTIVDAETVTSGGGTVEGVFTVGRADQGIRLFAQGDANSTNIDFQFYVKPIDGTVWHHVEGTSKKGVDITTSEYVDNALVFAPDMRPAEDIKVIVTNNAASDSVVTILVKPYLEI